MSKKSTTGGIVVGLIGAATCVASYLWGRNSQKSDDNDAAAEEYLDSIEAEDTTSTEEDEEEDTDE